MERCRNQAVEINRSSSSSRDPIPIIVTKRDRDRVIALLYQFSDRVQKLGNDQTEQIQFF